MHFALKLEVLNTDEIGVEYPHYSIAESLDQIVDQELEHNQNIKEIEVCRVH